MPFGDHFSEKAVSECLRGVGELQKEPHDGFARVEAERLDKLRDDDERLVRT